MPLRIAITESVLEDPPHEISHQAVVHVLVGDTPAQLLVVALHYVEHRHSSLRIGLHRVFVGTVSLEF